jgi:type IV secretory pathway TrbF-like protein
MNPLLYLKLGAMAIALVGAGYLGYSFEHNRFMAFKAKITEQTRIKEIQSQAAADQIRKEKDDQIKLINRQLNDAISELRKRPSRTETASHGQSCNGASLYAEDAEFLIREAARADEIRIGLDACYKQYDAVSK